MKLQNRYFVFTLLFIVLVCHLHVEMLFVLQEYIRICVVHGQKGWWCRTDLFVVSMIIYSTRAAHFHIIEIISKVNHFDVELELSKMPVDKTTRSQFKFC